MHAGGCEVCVCVCVCVFASVYGMRMGVRARVRAVCASMVVADDSKWVRTWVRWKAKRAGMQVEEVGKNAGDWAAMWASMLPVGGGR